MLDDRPPDPSGPAEKPDGRTESVSAVVLILVLAVGLYLEQSGVDPWIKFVGALVDAAFAVLGVRRLRRHAKSFLRVVTRLTGPPVRQWWAFWRGLPLWRGIPRRRTVLAGTLTLAILAAVLAIQPDRHNSPVVVGCTEPHEVRVLTSTDSLDWARQVFDAYSRSTATITGPGPGDGAAVYRCPTVHVLVYAAATGDTMTALAGGWTRNGTQDPVRDIGPRPDLWLPDSTVDVAAMLALSQKSGYAPPLPLQGAAVQGRISVTPDSVRSIGTSRIIFAARTPPAGPPASTLPWSQALAAAFQPGAALATPDPSGSTTGLFAMVGYLLDGAKLVGAAQARQRVQVVAGAKTVPGAGGVATLCQAGHDPSAGAVITTDQLWRLYAAAGGLGDLCAGGQPDFAGWTTAAPGAVPVLDHPLVQPTWTWSSTGQRAAAQELRTWLLGADGHSALVDAGLSAPLDCLSTGPAFTATPCVPVDPQAARQVYDLAKSPGRVLMAMDSSGSMNDPAGAGGSRFAVASAGFAEALGQIGGEDEVGLWTFPARSGPYQRLLDVGVGTAAYRKLAIDALRNVKPGGDTPLYRTIIDGLGVVAGAGTAGQTRALVVLTDGHDTSSDTSLQATRDKINQISAATGVRLYIVAIGEAACAGAQGLSALTDGHGGCLDADLDEIAGTMAQLFESLWKGQ